MTSRSDLKRCSRCDCLKPASDYYLNTSTGKPRRTCIRCYKKRQAERMGRKDPYIRTDRLPMPWESPPAVDVLTRLTCIWSGK